MVKNFETKLIEASSAEKFKAAKQLLKKSVQPTAWFDSKGRINSAIYDKINSRTISTVVTLGEVTSSVCNCGDCSGKLCEHAVAAIMYSGRFKREFSSIDDGVSKYAGLKFEDLESLANQGGKKLSSKVFIHAVSAFPHVPSKWENAVLSVKLRNADREYLGNINNLRQLFFEKSLSIALKREDFSLQDQQIIGFLAINGEPEGSNVLLNSEQTAEFFHCLVGYDRFLRDGRRLIVHGERTEAVILRRKEGGKTIISPGISVEGSMLPIKQAKVISGRAGCWIGRQGEYFFIPGSIDVSWLRNFFRTGEQILPKISENFLINGSFPVPVVDTNSLELEPSSLNLLFESSWGVDGELLLQINPIYSDIKVELNSGRMVRKNGDFVLRDERGELKLRSELEMFGFGFEAPNFVLKNSESIGLFLDTILPMWLNDHPNISLGGRLARLSAGGTGVPEVKFNCNIHSSSNDGYTMSYSFKTPQGSLAFKQLVSLARSGLSYVADTRGEMVKISDSMRQFLRGAENILRNINEKDQLFELPFFSVPYFIHLTKELGGACPQELFSNNLEPTTIFAPEHELKAELREYQREGVDWMRRMTDAKFNVILADEMGLGKTIQVLALLAECKRSAMAPALVICPASLVFNWEREAQKFVPDLKVAALASGKRENIWEDVESYDLIVTSYSLARKDTAYLRRHKFSYLILDEAQHIKNPGTANAQNCKQISAEHRIVLTGTPLENSTEDLWSIFDFLHPKMLGTFASFRNYYSNIGGDIGLQNDLAARVSPFLKRRTKAEVGTELPPKQESTIFCEMGEAQRKLYEDIRVNAWNQLKELKKLGKSANADIFTTLLRLRQVCCHPALLPAMDSEKAPNSAKFELLQELVLEHIDSGHKLLLFSQFTSLLAKISEWLDKDNIRYEYLDGSTKNRQQRVDNFNNDPTIPIFLLSLKAGGTGLNLTSADTVIICDPWWNPAVELQATDRTHRIGQTRVVSSIKLLVKDTIEEKILLMQEQKQDIFDSVIENPSANANKLSMEELQFLLSN